MEQTCEKCRWWETRDKVVDELSEGECHRFLPIVPCIRKINDFGITTPEVIRGSILTAYPTTYAPEWCGEFTECEY